MTLELGVLSGFYSRCQNRELPSSPISGEDDTWSRVPSSFESDRDGQVNYLKVFTVRPSTPYTSPLLLWSGRDLETLPPTCGDFYGRLDLTPDTHKPLTLYSSISLSSVLFDVNQSRVCLNPHTSRLNTGGTQTDFLLLESGSEKKKKHSERVPRDWSSKKVYCV